MKRQGNLICKIGETDNLYLAFWKACRGKHIHIEVMEYKENLEQNIKQVQQEILSGNIKIGDYYYFKIRDPKERIICAASFHQRVLHHAIMNLCHQRFEQHLIHQTYATRPKKGTFLALDCARKYTQKYQWYAKLDVRKYFDSIDQSTLKQNLRTLFKDASLLQIFYSIIDSYEVKPGKGVPIGNLTSQYFANFYLSEADHYAKEKLRLPYLRYMDDMLFFAQDKSTLIEAIKKFNDFVLLNLKLELKQVILHKTRSGVPFLGFRIFPYYTKLNLNSKRRFRLKFFRYAQYLESGKWSQATYQEHILPLLSFVKHADTLKLRKKYIFALEGQTSKVRTV